MSAAARWMIAIVGAVCAVSCAVVAVTVPPGVMNRTGLWIMAAFCGVIVMACFRGRLQKVAIRLLGAVVCAIYIGYIVAEIGHPLPNWRTYRKSDPNMINAVLGFVAFGLPGGYIAWLGRLPGSPERSLSYRRAVRYRYLPRNGEDNSG